MTDALHLKDSDETGQHTPLGQGAGDCQRILDDAVARGWSGPVTLEPHLKVAAEGRCHSALSFAAIHRDSVYKAARSEVK